MLTVLTDSQRVDAVRARGAGVRGSATIIIKKVKLEEDGEDEDLVEREQEKGGDDKKADGVHDSETIIS